MGREVNKTHIPIIYEEHNAKNGAYTEWSFQPPPIYERFLGGKTHTKVAAVVKKGTIARMVRLTHRGNLKVAKVKVDKPLFLGFLGGIRDLDPEIAETVIFMWKTQK